MENKLDVLTKKLYDEGINKAQQEAERILEEARQEATQIVANAEQKAKNIDADAENRAKNLKSKVSSELALSIRQSIATLKQSITNLVSGKISGEIAHKGFEDKKYVQDLMMEIVKKWDINSGNLDLNIILSDQKKKDFETYVSEKYKGLLDKGLEIKAGNVGEAFILQPKDGSYQITFSEELFASFFEQYMKGMTKELLYKE